MAIYEKLLAIQQKLKAPKNQYNDFGNYFYRSCEDILNAVKPLCEEQKALLVLSDDVKAVGGWVYVMATAKLIDLEAENQSIEIYGFAREMESKAKFDSSQLTGSASTYARKYALNGMFCIDDVKDADSLPPPDAGKATEKKQRVSAKQVADLQAMAKRKGVTVERIVDGYKLKSLQDIAPAQWQEAMNSLRKRADVS